jgi:hypothetical protein
MLQQLDGCATLSLVNTTRATRRAGRLKMSVALAKLFVAALVAQKTAQIAKGLR